jgi:hypothetical protein
MRLRRDVVGGGWRRVPRWCLPGFSPVAIAMQFARLMAGAVFLSLVRMLFDA